MFIRQDFYGFMRRPCRSGLAVEPVDLTADRRSGFEQRRQLVLLLIDRVIVTNGDVEIRYVLPTSSESEHVRFCQLRKDYFEHPAARESLQVFGGIGAPPGWAADQC